ncbi:MAG: hypothetical protein ACP5OU_07715 [Methanothrix sp.]
MPPNIKIDLFMVAPDQRLETIGHEIHGPAFARLKPPLLPSCGGEWSRSGGTIRYMKPEFISEIAQRAPRAGLFLKADEASPGPAATRSGAQWSISPNRGQALSLLLCGYFSFMVCRYLFHLFTENRCH